MSTQQRQMESSQRRRYYGKYRGKVLNNIDPLALGRIQAMVPAVPGGEINWALPCTPYAGLEVGFYTIPPIDASVWIEFEGGDPHYPIWAGCFWEEGEMPSEPAVPEKKVFKTESITMILNDLPEVGGFSLYVNPPAVDIPTSMVFNSEGITITCPPGTIVMTPEAITITLPPAIGTWTEELIEFTIPTSTITMNEEAILVNAGDITMTAEEAMEATAGADITLSAGAAMELSAGADVAISAGGAVEVSGGADVSIEAGGACEVTAGADVAVTAGLAAEITAGVDVAITAAAAMELTAAADIAITSLSVAMTALVEVTGDLLIDGQQPLVI